MRTVVAVGLVMLAGCSSDTTLGLVDAGPAVDANNSVSDAAAADAGVAQDASDPTDTGTVVDATLLMDAMSLDASPPDTGYADAAVVDAGPQYHEIRAVMHMHSVYSHDACDGEGLISGQPNATCLAGLRDAICASEMDYVGLTDHPSYMADYPFADVLLFDASAGDQLVDRQGQPVANRMSCAGGHEVLITAGYEGSPHMMPIGLTRHLASPTHYEGLEDSDPLQLGIDTVQRLRAAGAVVSMAHSEEDNISVQRILDVGLDSMEWYNPHGNFEAFLGGDILDGIAAAQALLKLDAFLLPGSNRPHSDLLFLLLLSAWPEEGFDKWREVQRTRSITGILGTDAHQNVSIYGIPLNLQDGDRLDSFARTLRWVENRIFVDDSTPEAVHDALLAGRVYGLFSVFGDPTGFELTGTSSGGQALMMGATRQGPVDLRIVVPARPVQSRGAPFTPAEGDTAEVRVVISRTDATGTTVVNETTNLNTVVTYAANAPGAYHVEIWIRPRHLLTALGSEDSLADPEYLWLITNPIRVLP